MLSQKSFRSYIHRVLKEVHPETNITKDAIDATDGILRTVATRVCNCAHLLTQGTEKKTISAREIQSATRTVFPGELAKNAVSEATKAVATYTKNTTESSNTKKKSPAKPQMRETKAGLIISVSLAEKYVRGFGRCGYNVGANAPVYLAGVIQYLAAELMEIAGNACHDSKRHNITVRHLFLATINDCELASLIQNSNVVILGGGVQPGIEAALLAPKPKKAIKRKKGDGTKKPHRWRPGTVAVREIRSYQKTSNLLMQRAPFDRLVREVTNAKENDLRFTSAFMDAFQNLVENDVVKMLESANLLAIHGKRETVQPEDVALALRIQNVTQENVSNLTGNVPEAAVRKLAYRAGVKRMSAGGTEGTRTFLKSTIVRYLRDVMICSEHNHRKTVNTKFLLEGLAMKGVSVATIPEKRRVKKRGTSSKSQASDAESVYSPTNDDDDDELSEEEEGVAVAKGAPSDIPEEEELLDDDESEEESESD